MTDFTYPDSLKYDYTIRFVKKASGYRLIHYSSPWENERELEDIRLIMDGKDLSGKAQEGFKLVEWENLIDETYDVKAQMELRRNPDGKSYEQLFTLVSLELAKNPEAAVENES